MRLPRFLPLLAFLIIGAGPPALPGRWDVTSTVVELDVPGVPPFVRRLARGHSTVEHKIVAPGEGAEALLAPDPKARCAIDAQRVADGRYDQTLSCPRKDDRPLRVSRSGTYDASGFSGRATVEGETSRGPMRIEMEQRAVRRPD